MSHPGPFAPHQDRQLAPSHCITSGCLHSHPPHPRSSSAHTKAQGANQSENSPSILGTAGPWHTPQLCTRVLPTPGEHGGHQQQAGTPRPSGSEGPEVMQSLYNGWMSPGQELRSWGRSQHPHNMLLSHVPACSSPTPAQGGHSPAACADPSCKSQLPPRAQPTGSEASVRSETEGKQLPLQTVPFSTDS